jgi:hypothetical protein
MPCPMSPGMLRQLGKMRYRTIQLDRGYEIGPLCLEWLLLQWSIKLS